MWSQDDLQCIIRTRPERNTIYAIRCFYVFAKNSEVTVLILMFLGMVVDLFLAMGSSGSAASVSNAK
jgi:hypothetical protein